VGRKDVIAAGLVVQVERDVEAGAVIVMENDIPVLNGKTGKDFEFRVGTRLRQINIYLDGPRLFLQPPTSTSTFTAGHIWLQNAGFCAIHDLLLL
jgi:hypothetical protein